LVEVNQTNSRKLVQIFQEDQNIMPLVAWERGELSIILGLKR